MKMPPIFLAFFLLLISFPIYTFSQQTAEDFYRQGIELAKKGKLIRRLRHLTKLSKTNQIMQQAYLESSRSKSNNQRDLLGAFADIESALQINPQFAEAYFIRSRLRFVQNLELLKVKGGMNDEEFLPYVSKELEDLNSAINYGYKNKEIYLIRADIYSRSMREPQMALEDYTLALNFDPKDVMILSNRANIRQMLGDFAGAFEDVLQASLLAPDNIRFQTMLASILAKLGNSEKSLEQIDKLIQYLEKLPTHSQVENQIYNSTKLNLSEIYRVRAGIFHVRHDEVNEFADLAKSVEIAPNDVSYRIRAKIYANHDMFAQAVADFTKALEKAKNTGILFFERGNIYFELRKYDEALKDYESAAANDSGFKEPVIRMIEQIKKLRN